MNINTQTEGYTVPTAFVTKGRQRVKQYNNRTVYLNNGDEFEIELFNPTTNKVMAKVDLNGISIGPGIVLNPGQRVILERYINEAKKFLYMTYEVDGGNTDVQRAIANNGDVAVKFYIESLPPSGTITWNNPFWSSTTDPQYYGTSYTTNCSNGSPTPPSMHNMKSPVRSKLSKTIKNFGDNFAGGQGESQSILNTMNFMDVEFERSFETIDSAPDTMQRGIVNEPEKTIETGRIEKGSHSNQSFGRDHSTFNTFWSWKTEWKILPVSQRPVEVQDLVLYCTSCQARRRRDSHKFCPICGKKY